VHKKTAYEGLVLSILFYGCETWSLPKQQLNRLQMFHNLCVRAMCRVTMWHASVREHKITQVSLERRMQLEPFEYYLARQRLRWAGSDTSAECLSLVCLACSCPLWHEIYGMLLLSKRTFIAMQPVVVMIG
jgi:hypothetical protein